MDFSYKFILLCATLLLISILATNVFSRVGAPILMIFLIIGMLAGVEGPGGVRYADMQSAHLVGVLALAVILLNAGLKTKVQVFRLGFLPGLSLALAGTLITSFLVGIFATYLFHLNILEGMLIGAILGPTDAAALISVLHTTKIKQRVAVTLEIESGINDPIAILLTISLIKLLMHNHATNVYEAFILEVGIGGIVGTIMGCIIAWINNRINLERSLYPLFIFSSAMVVFAGTDLIGGSGYLAIYIVGLIIGNNEIHEHKNIYFFHDNLAWLAQISMFLLLGLLVTPSDLFPHMVRGLVIIGVLIFVARPTAVWLCLLPFKFNWREKLFIAWTGLKGAVPIVLAINPALVGLENSSLYFNLTFFVVIVSVFLQSWPLSKIAQWSRINEQ